MTARDSKSTHRQKDYQAAPFDARLYTHLCKPGSFTDQALQSLAYAFRQHPQTFFIIKIFNVADVAKVERNIALMLCNQDHILPQRMRDTSLIENVRVLAGQISDHNSCTREAATNAAAPTI